MPFRTILTVTGPDLGDEDLDVAAAFCEDANRHLSVLVITPAAPPPMGEFAAMVSEAWMQERQEDMERLNKRSEAVNQFLARAQLSADVTTEYPELAWTDEAIGRRARYADLTLAGPELLGTRTLKEKVIEGALFSSGRPLLLMPQRLKAPFEPRRVMIAWDARPEAARAVHEALEFLTQAGEVRVVLVDPVESETGHGAEPGADIAAYLARHGVKVTVDCLPSEGHSVTSVLRRHAVANAAELLVAGAYGHSRLRERVFGGVTKSLLDDPQMPVLMAR